MLVGQDYAGGEESYWWERIMLVGKDHVAGKRSCWCCMMITFAKLWFLCRTNIVFAQNRPPYVRPQQKSQQTICYRAPHPFPPTIFRKKMAMSRSTRNFTFFLSRCPLISSPNHQNGLKIDYIWYDRDQNGGKLHSGSISDGQNGPKWAQITHFRPHIRPDFSYIFL